MNRKLGIAVAALMVAALVAPTVMGADYTVTVCSGQSTSITSIDGTFGDVLVNSAKLKEDSVVLKNSGDWPAKVTASGPDFSDETNTMSIGSLTINSVAVTNSGAVIEASLPADDTDYSYDQELTIPGTQPSGLYSTTVTLAWENA